MLKTIQKVWLVARPGAPVEVTLALQPEGPSLRISHDALAVTLTF